MMGSFALALLVGAVFLYVPGYLLLRGCRFDRAVAVACAPVVALLAYGGLAIAYGKASVGASWGLLFGPSLAAGAALWAAASLRARGAVAGRDQGAEAAERRRAARFDGLGLGLYAVAGVVVGCVVFLASIGSPGAFMQDYDNVHHLTSIKAFLDSGDWSSLGVTYYPLEGEEALRPFPDGAFYPSAWHDLVAMVADALGCELPVAVTATLFLLAFVAFPLGMFLLMRTLFGDRPQAVLLGSCCVMLFAAFPGGFLKFGPLYPNLAAFAVLPAVVACFLLAFDGAASRRRRLAAGALCAAGVVALGLTQPNAAFTMAVFLVPFCAGRAMGLADRLPVAPGRRRLVRALLCLGFLILALGLWTALYKAPFLQGVVTHAWGSFTGISQALVDAVTLGYRGVMAQPLLAALVILGVAWTLYHREHLWLVCSYALVVVMYVAVARVDGLLRFFLTGFWYTDPYRIAAMAELFAMPLAVVGLWCAARGARWLLGCAAERTGSGALAQRWALPLVGVALMVAGLWPGFEVHGWGSVQTAMGALRDELALKYDTDAERIYDEAEQAFVEEALEALPEGALVVNDPNDGSIYAHSVDGLNALFRNPWGYGGDDEAEASRVIRQRLDAVADDGEVQAALRQLGAGYVLLLDQGPNQASQHHLWTYSPEKWPGLNGIDDATPGFEVVLARDDMRLYRISALDEAA